MGKRQASLVLPHREGHSDVTADFPEGPAGVSFDADSGHNYGRIHCASMLGNISTRGFVGTGNNVMIGGLIINGSASKTVILRALGPTLGRSPFNIPAPCADPMLEFMPPTAHYYF